MSPEQAAKYLFELMTSVPDGDIQLTVSRSSLLPACTIKVVKRIAGAFRQEASELVTSDDFASTLEKAKELYL